MRGVGHYTLMAQPYGESAPAAASAALFHHQEAALMLDMSAPMPSAAGGSSLLPEDLKPVSYALVAVVLAFGVVCGALLCVRRHKFPMNGRATGLVMPVLVGSDRSS